MPYTLSQREEQRLTLKATAPWRTHAGTKSHPSKRTFLKLSMLVFASPTVSAAPNANEQRRKFAFPRRTCERFVDRSERLSR
ncbi:hypothetical protein RRG08_036746 [Elysia crispata]|uniref:Uncharacterized protein n=1 Tax=Elysia crispata TaxID=231223 RepID=A0AAE0ZII0_9GAST|nr:hypothetical protein RRG08_036746 [Elysia crispata]